MHLRGETFGKTNDAAFSAIVRTPELRICLEHNRAALFDYGRRR